MLVLLALLSGCSSSELDPVVAKVCAKASCVGKFSRIQVYRDAQGEAQRLVYDGDLEVCSHPSRVYYDGSGKMLDSIPERPVVSDTERDAFVKRQRALVAGLEDAEVHLCP